jgi:hypothetical protein
MWWCGTCGTWGDMVEGGKFDFEVEQDDFTAT